MSHSADPPPPSTTPTPTAAPARGVRVLGLVVAIVGVLMAVAGVVTYVTVQQTLADQRITVADDADFLAGDKVDGPFSAYAQAMVIGKHAEEIGGGKTYAELERDDPARDTVMTASFLQASLFTSVVAFGVAVLVIVLGALLVLIGIALRRLSP